MKKAQIPKPYFSLVGLWILVLIAGCVGNYNRTPTWSPIGTDTPTIRRKPTRLGLTSPSPGVPFSITPSLTEAIMPTMASSDFKALLYNISENNGGCNLPCIWGINPITQSPEDFRAFAGKFGNVDFYGDYSIYSDYSGNGNDLYFMDWENDWETDIAFYQRGKSKIDYLILDVLVPNTKQVDYWSNYQTSPFQMHYSNYLLPNIFQTYGQPRSVYIGPDPEDDEPTRRSPWIPFSVLLFYPDQGFLIDYLLPKNVENDYFTGCLSHVNELTIVSWNPDPSKSLVDIVADLPQGYWQWMSESRLKNFYRSIDQIMPIEQFYNTYTSSAYPDCIRVPKDLWPYK